jgi:6-phosphogluconolactonase
MSPTHHIFESKAPLAHYFANRLQTICNDKDKVFVAISGGTTPQYIFDVMSSEYQTSIDWQKIRLFWVDERCVPPTDADSNYGMTVRHLLSKVAIPDNQIYRIKGELPNEEALSQYITEIEKTVPLVDGSPKLDLVVLGMGDDGHTASVFPHQINLWHSPRICELANHPTSGQVRVTLTGGVINDAREIIFLVTGAGKAPKVSEIFTRKPSAQSYPASLVDETHCTWLLDKEAAQLL